MKFDDGPPMDAAVAQGLSALKREGGSVLVVGATNASHADICRRFVGEGNRQVLVRTDGCIRSDCADDLDAVIDRPVATRSAAQATASTSLDLGSIEREMRTEMERLAGGEPLRVCVDSLRPFVDTTDEPTLVSFLESVGETATETGAVVHFHLPAVRGAVPKPLFDAVDAVVELTRQGESTYQQWHLPETGDTTEWVSV